jgi:hypothetical protein
MKPKLAPNIDFSILDDESTFLTNTRLPLLFNNKLDDIGDSSINLALDRFRRSLKKRNSKLTLSSDAKNMKSPSNFNL